MDIQKPTLSPEQAREENYRLHRRFDRIGRLIGDAAIKKLLSSHVIVIGLGGVGSWAAEMLVRSGVGKVTLVDFDEVCVTNANRQVQALSSVIGKNKADVLAERFLKINPQVKIVSKVLFYNPGTRDEIFLERPDYVVDAIDNITAKCHLLSSCQEMGVPVICCTGSAGRMDPTKIKTADLSETDNDPLARQVRKILRQKYGYSEKRKFGITAVYSDENITEPFDLTYDGGEGFHCVCPQNENDKHTCDDRNIILGSAGFVTGAFGFIAAGRVVQDLISIEKAALLEGTAGIETNTPSAAPGLVTGRS